MYITFKDKIIDTAKYSRIDLQPGIIIFNAPDSKGKFYVPGAGAYLSFNDTIAFGTLDAAEAAFRAIKQGLRRGATMLEIFYSRSSRLTFVQHYEPKS